MLLAHGLYVYEKPGMGQHGSHTYVVVGEKKTLLIDPGFSHNLHDLVVQKMVDDGISPKDVELMANTHLHLDHSDADEAFAKISGAWIVFHRSQVAFLDDEASAHPVFRIPKKIDSSYEGEIDLGGIRVQVVETPGHCRGHLCFYIPTAKALISGDLVFENNVGRTDLPSGDEAEERRSLRKIASLDLEMVLPAHGKLFLSAEEARRNLDLVLANWTSLE